MFQKNKLFFTYLIIILIFLISFPRSCFSSTNDLTFSPSSSLSLNSKSAVVIERSTGTILFGKNENQKRKMASTTKIMTAILVLENTDDLSANVIISKKAASIGGSRLGLSANDKITVKDLIYGLLLCSGNDAAIALSEFISGSVENFVYLMNKKALDLNLSNTHFMSPHGLDNDEHYTTAFELALLTKYALEHKLFSEIVSTLQYSVSINNSSKLIHNTNELLGNLNGIYGVKTGFTNGANRCLVTACIRGDLDIICVVLGADTKNFRTQDNIKLIEYVFSNFEMVNINLLIQEKFSEWKTNTSDYFFIKKGIYNFIESYIESCPYEKYPVNKQNKKDIITNISCNYILDAPLLINTEIGVLNCYVNNSKICSLKIYSSNFVPRKSPFSYFYEFIKKFPYYLEKVTNF